MIPDLVFGFIDGCPLTILALIGASLAGVFGAILGGAIGNAITDGIGGAVEGKISQILRKKGVYQERTALRSAVAKMAGVLIGVGLTLIVAWTILGLF